MEQLLRLEAIYSSVNDLPSTISKASQLGFGPSKRPSRVHLSESMWMIGSIMIWEKMMRKFRKIKVRLLMEKIKKKQT